MSAVSIGFDYAALAPDDAAAAKGTAERIRGRLRASWIDTGQDLIAIKDRLGHGKFGAWLGAEFDMTERTAQRYMKAAELAAVKSDIVSYLVPSTLFALSAPDASPEVVAEALGAAEEGRQLAPKLVKEKLAEARKRQLLELRQRQRLEKDRKGRAARNPGKSPAELDALGGEQIKRRQRREEADRRQAELDEQRRADRLQPLAVRIAAALGDDLPTLIAGLNDYQDRQTLGRLLAEASP